MNQEAGTHNRAGAVSILANEFLSIEMLREENMQKITRMGVRCPCNCLTDFKLRHASLQKLREKMLTAKRGKKRRTVRKMKVLGLKHLFSSYFNIFCLRPHKVFGG